MIAFKELYIPFLLFLGATTLFGIHFILRPFYLRILPFYLKSFPKISDAKPGVITICGAVTKFNYVIVSPLSKTICCGYQYVVYDRFTKGYGRENVVHSESRVGDFIVDDKSGKCLIHAKTPGIFMNSSLWPPTIRFSDYINLEEAILHNDLKLTPDGRKKYRHMEYCRQEGELVRIKGMFQRQDNDVNSKQFDVSGFMTADYKNKVPLIIKPAYPGERIRTTNQGNSLFTVVSVIAALFGV